MANEILPPSNNVVSLALGRQERRLDDAVRREVRDLLGKFDVVRASCPTASLLVDGGIRSQKDGPLTPAEIKAVRQMLEDFEAIKVGCPMARRLLADV